MISVHFDVARAPIPARMSLIQLVIQRKTVTANCSSESEMCSSRDARIPRITLQTVCSCDLRAITTLLSSAALCGELSRLLQSLHGERNCKELSFLE